MGSLGAAAQRCPGKFGGHSATRCRGTADFADWEQIKGVLPQAGLPDWETNLGRAGAHPPESRLPPESPAPLGASQSGTSAGRAGGAGRTSPCRGVGQSPTTLQFRVGAILPADGSGDGRGAHAQDALRDLLRDVMKHPVVAQETAQPSVQVGRTRAAKLSPECSDDLDFSVPVRLPTPLSPLVNDAAGQEAISPFPRALEDICHISDKLGPALSVRQSKPLFTLPVQLLGANVLFYGRDAHGSHAFIVQCRFI